MRALRVARLDLLERGGRSSLKSRRLWFAGADVAARRDTSQAPLAARRVVDKPNADIVYLFARRTGP
jgi:hypothetical protein